MYEAMKRVQIKPLKRENITPQDKKNATIKCVQRLVLICREDASN